MRAGTFGRIEGEHVWRRVLIGDAGNRVHQSLGEILHLLTAFLDDSHHAVALFHGDGNTLADAFFVSFAHHELVYHHLDVVVLVSVNLHARHNLQNLSIHPGIEITLAPHAVEEFTVMTLALSDERSEEVDSLAGILIENHLDDLFLGIFHHLLAAAVAVGSTGTGIEQTQVVVNLGSGAHGRSGILVGGLLLDADDRTETSNLIHIRTFHVAQEVAGIGRERLDIATLTFGKDGVEGQ